MLFLRAKKKFRNKRFIEKLIKFIVEKILCLPSSRKDSSSLPPGILVIWIASRLPDPFNLNRIIVQKIDLQEKIDLKNNQCNGYNYKYWQQ